MIRKDVTETRISRAKFLRAAAAGTGLLAVPGLASCGLGGGSETALRLAGFADFQEATNTMIERYQEQNPDTTFETTYAPVDQVQSSLRPQLASGNAPDMHVVWPGNGNALAMIPLVQANLLENLSDQPWASEIPESFERVFAVEGETYFFTPSFSMIGAIYNKNVFDELGLQIPETWDDLISTCEEIKADGRHPIALGNQTPWVTQLINYALVASTVFAENPDFAEQHLEGNADFSDSGWQEAFEKYMELNEQEFFNPNPLGTTYEQQLQMVASGEAAMAVQTSGGIPQIESYGEPGQFAVFAFPGVNDPDMVRVPAAPGNGFGVSPNSDFIEESKAFITFMSETENMNDFADITGSLPVIPNEQAEDPEALQPMMPFVEQDKGVPYMDQLWPNPEVQQVHFAVVQEAFTGETTISDALRRMEDAYEQES